MSENPWEIPEVEAALRKARQKVDSDGDPYQALKALLAVFLVLMAVGAIFGVIGLGFTLPFKLWGWIFG